MESSLSQGSYGGYGYSSSQAAQAAMYAELFSLKCDTGFVVVGLQDGEAVCTPIRVLSTLITISVASAWFSRRKAIKKLLLFFGHWLAGLLHQLAFMAEATMILVCWTGENLEALAKTLKFVELAAGHMLAITNLAICVNLALIIMSHRTFTRVRSVSSPWLMLLFVAISLAAAAATVPFWDYTVISGTGFWVASNSERSQDWINVSGFYIELFVGTCMFFIVGWLLLFRKKEIRECWKIHIRIRYYFGLTIIGTAVNLGLGICGTIYTIRKNKGELMVVITWAFRYIHVALDTIVLYGVLGARGLDERAGSPSSSGAAAVNSASGSALGSRGGRAPSKPKAKRGKFSNNPGLKEWSGLSKRSSSHSQGAVSFSSGSSNRKDRSFQRDTFILSACALVLATNWWSVAAYLCRAGARRQEFRGTAVLRICGSDRGRDDLPALMAGHEDVEASMTGDPEELRRQQAHLKFTASHQARHAARQYTSVGYKDEDRPKDESTALFNETFAASTQDITSALARLVAERKQKPSHTAAGTGLSGARHAQGAGAANGLGGFSDDSPAEPAAAVDSREDVRERLDALVERVKGLRKRTAEASLFLTVYDLRKAQEEVDRLWASVESTRAELAPRKKFAFRSKTKTKTKAIGQSMRKSNAEADGGQGQGQGQDKKDEDSATGGAIAIVEEQQQEQEQGGDGPGLHNLKEQELEVTAENADKDQDFNVTDVEKCKVTILHVLGALRLRRLTSCRVVCGPVRGPIYVEGCKDCVIVAAGRQLRIHDSEGVDFYVLVASGPIIEDCCRLRFAPTVLRYPQYQNHLQAAGLEEGANAWKDVKDFKWHRALKSPNWDVIPEAERESDPLGLKALK
eukprot:g5057.t1